ncbi:MAG: histidine kinase [Anaerolineales bacterium]|jgi:signal transduction histidine kinase
MMIIIYFFYGLFFGGLGLAALLQLRRGGDFPLRKHLPWLAAFGLTYGAVSWVDMFLTSRISHELVEILTIIRIVLQPLSGLLLLFFGWGILTKLEPLPSWTIFIPGVLIVPIAFIISYAVTTFITPSPIEIPIDIWSSYLLYLPGSVMAGIGFLRQWKIQGRHGHQDVSNLMLGAGLAFLFEAFVVGLVVPAAPYGPASYYNYDRVLSNAFIGEQIGIKTAYGLTAWLDYERVLEVTGLPIQFWRLVSAIAVTFFVMRGLDVFDAIRKRKLHALQLERDNAQKAAYETQITARQTAEGWTDALVSISRRIAELEDVDDILLYIVGSARELLKSDFIGIGLLNEEYTCLELKCFSTHHRTEMVTSPLLVKNPLIYETALASRPYRSKGDKPLKMLENICFFEDIQAKEVVIVPLTLDKNPIGALWIARCGKRSYQKSYSETDLIWLESMADQVVIAIKHGVMTAQLQSLSVIEERTRIAREMHDGLAQILGYLNLQVQTLESLLNQGKPEMLLTELKNMRASIQLAHADVRENILSLRTTLAHEKGFVPAIIEYLDEFGVQTGIQVQFKNKIEDELNISSLAEVELVCILQEALANVRKHAEALNVKVLLTREIDVDEEYINLSIVDDGIGFTLSDSIRRFGLQTMRERARSVSGELIVHSTPGEGTRVECKLPCLYHEKLEKESILIS